MAKLVTPEMEKINRHNITRSGKVKTYSYWSDAWIRLKRNPTAIVGLVIISIVILAAIFAGFITSYDYSEVDYGNMLAYPSSEHWFGTDNLGRDLFTRCIYGSRWSLSIGFVCMILALIGGGMLGLTAAFFGGKVDTVIMRIMDVFQAIPGTLMTITIVGTLGVGTPQLLFALGVSNMPGTCKMVRAAIFTVRGNEFIEATRSIGASDLRLMFRHVVPNALGHIIIFALGSVAMGIMVISTLSYIGLGVQPPAPEWGALLNAGRGYIGSHPYLIVFPGLMIMITVLSLNLLGNGLRDALDPRLK